MNLSEFKAWFEGFTEEMNGLPTAKQWKKIKARVGEITSDPTPWPIVVDRYIRPIQPYWSFPQWSATTGGMSANKLTNERAFNMIGHADAEAIGDTET